MIEEKITVDCLYDLTEDENSQIRAFSDSLFRLDEAACEMNEVREKLIETIAELRDRNDSTFAINQLEYLINNSIRMDDLRLKLQLYLEPYHRDRVKNHGKPYRMNTYEPEEEEYDD